MHSHIGWKWILVEILGFIVLTILDQWTKVLSVTFLKEQEPYVLIDGVLELRYVENRGAAFSSFQNATWVFWIIAIAVILFIVWFLHVMPADRLYLPIRVILIFVASGAMGNLIDRMTLTYVRDFVYFSLIDFPVFNVADIYLTVSIAILIALILFYYKDSDFAWMEQYSWNQSKHDK